MLHVFPSQKGPNTNIEQRVGCPSEPELKSNPTWASSVKRKKEPNADYLTSLSDGKNLPFISCDTINLFPVDTSGKHN